MTDWISVKDKMPDEYITVLVLNKRGRRYDIGLCWWDEYRWHGTGGKYNFQNITHWMPLPEPPKE